MIDTYHVQWKQSISHIHVLAEILNDDHNLGTLLEMSEMECNNLKNIKLQ